MSSLASAALGGFEKELGRDSEESGGKDGAKDTSATEAGREGQTVLVQTTPPSVVGFLDPR